MIENVEKQQIGIEVGEKINTLLNKIGDKLVEFSHKKPHPMEIASFGGLVLAFAKIIHDTYQINSLTPQIKELELRLPELIRFFYEQNMSDASHMQYINAKNLHETLLHQRGIAEASRYLLMSIAGTWIGILLGVRVMNNPNDLKEGKIQISTFILPKLGALFTNAATWFPEPENIANREEKAE